MNNSEYWQERSEQNIILTEQIADSYNEQLAREYSKVIKSLQQQLYEFYALYAGENGLTLQEAQKKLSSKELKELRATIDEYIEEAQKFDSKNANKYLKNLEELQAKAKVSRLELLMAEYRHAIEILLLQQEVDQPNIYLEGYESSFYHTLYDIQTYSGIGATFTRPTKDMVVAALAQKYLGQNFSDRLWQNKEMLIYTLKKEIKQAFAAGTPARNVAETVAKKMNTRLGVAQTLVRTEMANVANQGSLLAYKEAGVKEYKLLATLDLRTSEICRELDGNVYLVSQAERGVNYPPFHPNCRTTTVPVVDGESYHTRIAKKDDSYEVVKDITYKQWYKKYVKD